MERLSPGDFSRLAKDYALHRPGYSLLIRNMVLGATGRPPADLDIVDVGAGTGIWTRELRLCRPASVTAVEPNQQMRQEGVSGTDSDVRWLAGSAEATTLPNSSVDVVTMASSFHWADTDVALAEFDRILRAGGVFAAVWNPRVTELSAVESDIDALLREKYQLVSRKSSGRSGITLNLTEILRSSGFFEDVAYCEALEVALVPRDRYLGAWRSVNDVRSQLGEVSFDRFIQDVTDLTKHLEEIDVHYLTRCWIARKG